MLFTLFRAPVADLRAESTVFLYILAVSCHGLGTQYADLKTFPAARRAIVVAFKTHHLVQTILTIHRAIKTRFNTFFITHYSTPLIFDNEFAFYQPTSQMSILLT